jgi:hypothetical protein
MRVPVLLVWWVVGCAGDVPDPMSSGMGPQESDGEYLDPLHGVCVGGVGGTTRCSGNDCVGLAEEACGAAPRCFIAYDETSGARAFRQCLPVSVDALARGACTTLSARVCATRQDCVGIYRGVSIYSSFVACEPDFFDPTRN